MNVDYGLRKKNTGLIIVAFVAHHTPTTT